jgi:hypothetical protein
VIYQKPLIKVWHRGLLKKLKAYGISGNLLHWFENYLSDRNQKVVLQNCFLEVGNVKGGVPQGSVFTPLLFILYINDITEDIQSLSRLFADDASLSYSSSNINEIEQRLNSDMMKIYNWSKKLLVDFYPQKTKCMLFSTNQGNIKPQILFNNEEVEFVVNHKHLGVTFSSNCKWHCHIQNILKSPSGQLSMLRKFKIKLNRENLEKNIFYLYKAIMRVNCGMVVPFWI